MISQVREWPWEHQPTSVAPGYFWPVWPMIGWVFGLASHGLAARGGAGWHAPRETRLTA